MFGVTLAFVAWQRQLRWKAGYLHAVSPGSHAVNQVLDLGVDVVENEEQKRLTKYAAWTWSRG